MLTRRTKGGALQPSEGRGSCTSPKRVSIHARAVVCLADDAGEASERSPDASAGARSGVVVRWCRVRVGARSFSGRCFKLAPSADREGRLLAGAANQLIDRRPEPSAIGHASEVVIGRNLRLDWPEKDHMIGCDG
jgi:hypothetical protein